MSNLYNAGFSIAAMIGSSLVGASMYRRVTDLHDERITDAENDVKIRAMYSMRQDTERTLQSAEHMANLNTQRDASLIIASTCALGVLSWVYVSSRK